MAAIPNATFANVPGVTPKIVTIGLGAYKQGLLLAFRAVFYVALGLLLVNLLLSFFFPNLDGKMTNEVVAELHRPQKTSKKDIES